MQHSRNQTSLSAQDMLESRQNKVLRMKSASTHDVHQKKISHERNMMKEHAFIAEVRFEEPSYVPHARRTYATPSARTPVQAQKPAVQTAPKTSVIQTTPVSKVQSRTQNSSQQVQTQRTPVQRRTVPQQVQAHRQVPPQTRAAVKPVAQKTIPQQVQTQRVQPQRQAQRPAVQKVHVPQGRSYLEHGASQQAETHYSPSSFNAEVKAARGNPQVVERRKVRTHGITNSPSEDMRRRRMLEDRLREVSRAK